MADGDLIGRSAGVVGAFGHDHVGTGAEVVTSVALTQDVAGATDNHAYIFLFFFGGNARNNSAATDILGGCHMVMVLRTDGPGWVVFAGAVFGTVGSDATPTFTFAMNGDALEASGTATADTSSWGGFLKVDIANAAMAE